VNGRDGDRGAHDGEREPVPGRNAVRTAEIQELQAALKGKNRIIREQEAELARLHEMQTRGADGHRGLGGHLMNEKDQEFVSDVSSRHSNDAEEALCRIIREQEDCIKELETLPPERYACMGCGRLSRKGWKPVTYETDYGTEYDIECPDCGSREIRESAQEALSEMADRLDTTEAELARLREERRERPMSEHPETGRDEVLISYTHSSKNGKPVYRLTVGWYEGGEWYWNKAYDIMTYARCWLPMPVPPAEGGE
jgi:DNA-directed RNA polymerase subunit RPC12/RpoP